MATFARLRNLHSDAQDPQRRKILLIYSAHISLYYCFCDRPNYDHRDISNSVFVGTETPSPVVGDNVSLIRAISLLIEIKS